VRPDPIFEVGLRWANVLLAPENVKTGRDADVAQLVERNLAKVEVAGSNPVVRSERVRQASFLPGGVAERRGNGLQSRVHGFESRLHLDTFMCEPEGVVGFGRLAQR
jgi:hypothetical protein